MSDADLLATLHSTADSVVSAFAGKVDWGLSGTRDGQYASDLVADAAALDVLHRAGLRVLSEESGLGDGDGPIVVVDPLDGSTNASLALPWFATSLAVMDNDGPRVAVVHNHGNGERYEAVRGGGARRDGEPLRDRADDPAHAGTTAVNGVPPSDIGWFRCMGAAALDLCAVADGRFRGYIDFHGGLGVWDYAGAALVCIEAGVEIVDAEDRDLFVVDHDARRAPVAGPPALIAELRALRERP